MINIINNLITKYPLKHHIKVKLMLKMLWKISNIQKKRKSNQFGIIDTFLWTIWKN